MANTSDPISASSPDLHAVVAASAGTGKTYLLVTRIIRLLLNEARPEGILALTFTRKAAGEMRNRLHDRLRLLATVTDDTLRTELRNMDVAADPAIINRARRLYEQVLLCARPPRITTFHAFCQELLQRFPLEADVPPGYELLENAGTVQEAAWDALCLQAAGQPDGEPAQSLENLFIVCKGLSNTRAALLEGFLPHRNDWLAFTLNERQPSDYACDYLQRFLQIDATDDIADFFSADAAGKLQTCSELLLKHPITQNTKAADSIAQALRVELAYASRFDYVKDVFLTKDLQPRKREHSKTLESKLGFAGVQQLLQLHEHFCAAILHTHERLLRKQYWRTNCAWYRAGHALLQHYQRIKQEQRLLDFDDLEWKTQQLLHHQDYSLWVQYKIDQKIDHFLIDEFQDTNPTQWRLLLPLLEEIADSKDAQRARSVFLVGDSKQSIYGFRRADPQLQAAAGAWLKEQLSAREFSLAKSRRSSPAIMQALNCVFIGTPLSGHLPAYTQHATHLKNLWGQVEILPLNKPDIAEPAEPSAPARLRDPLLEPRSAHDAQPYYGEGLQIAQRILEIVDAGYIVHKNSGQTGRVDYGDILILFRNRTHIADYEQALSDHRIPYESLAKGGLLDHQEVQDIEALLNVLVTPFNNLALAHILKSPIFAATDADLIQLAGITAHAHWYERLQACAADNRASPALLRAQQRLAEWRQWLPLLPTHDLLDRIFFDGDLIARYRLATPPALRSRVTANLQQLLGMALEIDSGRYPSLMRFLNRLKQARASRDQPDAPVAADGGRKVRLLTIHAAKGLEAPVVFLADSVSAAAANDAYQALVHWPHAKNKPEHMILQVGKHEMPAIMNAVLDSAQIRQTAERANLLYVALSRAKHMLLITGTAGQRNADELNWYDSVLQAVQPHATLQDDGRYILTHGQPSIQPQQHSPESTVALSPQHMDMPIAAATSDSIRPSHLTDNKMSAGRMDGDAHAEMLRRQRGTVIHKVLELLAPPDAIASLNPDIFLTYGISRQRAADWYAEAVAVLQTPELRFLFDPTQYRKAYKEAPLAYKTAAGEIVYGIIDRIVVIDAEVWIVDYKTHADQPGMIERYAAQLNYYAAGLRKLWPDKHIRPAILVCESKKLIEIGPA
jgi:ATP-dependent helicase/nuclease subunit A